MATQQKRHHSHFQFVSAIKVLSLLVGCGSSTEELTAVDYAPLSADDWDISTPATQGLDPNLVAELYYNASELETDSR